MPAWQNNFYEKQNRIQPKGLSQFEAASFFMEKLSGTGGKLRERAFLPATRLLTYWSFEFMRSMVFSVGLLCCSNIFMTFAWYGHLKNMSNKPWLLVALISWCIAFFEYLLQVPANRIGYQVMSLGQLKILQEVITLSIFIPFSILFMKEEFRYDYIWAGLCILGAVFFIFRRKVAGI